LNKSTVVGALVILMLGVGFGSVFLPRTVTQTTTQTTTQITTRVTTLTITTNSSLAVVTATVFPFVLVEHVVATCTTISGTTSIVYVYLLNGETTTVTTVYPQHVPPGFQVTLTTVSTGSVSNQTIVSQPDTC
jgi:hypothetical protein